MSKTIENPGIKFKDESGVDWIAYPGDALYETVKAKQDKGEQEIVIPNVSVYGSSTENKGYDWVEATRRIKEDLGKYSFFLQPKTFGKALEFPEDLTKLSSQELGQWMSKLESYRSFVMTQLAWLDVDRTMMQNVFDIGLGKTMGILESRTEKKKLKEILQAEAVAGNKKLAVVKQKLMEIDAKYQALEKLSQIYTGQLFTISREMSRRQGSGEAKYTV